MIDTPETASLLQKEIRDMVQEVLGTNDSQNELLDEAQETLLELVALRRKAAQAGFSWTSLLSWIAQNSMGVSLVLAEEDIIEEPIFYSMPASTPTPAAPDYTGNKAAGAAELSTLQAGEASEAKLIPDAPTTVPNAANLSPVVPAAPELGSAPSVQATANGGDPAIVTP